MAEQRAWTVTYTAKQTVTSYQEREITVQFTEAELKAVWPSFDTFHPDDQQSIIEQFAAERGRYVDVAWKETSESEEDRDPEDFEIEETPS